MGEKEIVKIPFLFCFKTELGVTRIQKLLADPIVKRTKSSVKYSRKMILIDFGLPRTRPAVKAV